MNLVCPLVMVVLLSTQGPSAKDSEATMMRGRERCEQFYAGEYASIWGQLSPEMITVFGESIDGLKNFGAQVGAQLGSEKKIVSESVSGDQGLRVYRRVSEFTKAPGTFVVTWQFDEGGKVTSFGIAPSKKEAETRFLEYETKTKLRLPFEGPWTVFWGGRTLPQNYHTAYRDQRFAYDLLVMKNGVSHSGDGKSNDDYYCFGKRLVAPGEGIVVSAENSVPDNVPGVLNPKQALGNHVIIEHGHGEFSFMAHFQQGTVAVKRGDPVKLGQFLGLAGNSGNSSEPHLHYHLQNTSVFNAGEGLPAQFSNYLSDGLPVRRGEPKKGDVIESQ